MKIRRKEQGLVALSKNLETNKKDSIYIKRQGYIYKKVYDLNNIKTAIWNASEKKRDQKRVIEILMNMDHYALEIQKILMNKTYIPSDPKVKIIRDGVNQKTRTIYKPDFYPDQIIHWALMLQIDPIIMRGMYVYSCGSVPGRGTSYGHKTVRKWLDNDYRNTKWYLQMDIEQYYPSIDNELLKKLFRRKIKDKDCLWLIDIIIDGNAGQPIGYYTAQWFSNFFLEELDHYIKRELETVYYVRYVDDLVLLGPNKKKLHVARQEVERYLSDLELNLKGNWHVSEVDERAIDFLGLRFFRDKTILRKSTALRIKRRAAKIRRKGYLNKKDASAILSYWGWIKHSNSYNFYHKYVKPVVPIPLARKVVSINAKIRDNFERGIGCQRHYVARL